MPCSDPNNCGTAKAIREARHGCAHAGLPHKAIPVSKLEPGTVSCSAFNVRFGSNADIGERVSVSGMSALPPRADVAQHTIEDRVVGEGPSICCTGDDDSGVCAVARSCKQKKFPQAGSCAAAPVSEPDSGGVVDSRAPPWVKRAACHEP